MKLDLMDCLERFYKKMKIYNNIKYYLLNLGVLIALSIFIGDLFIMPIYVRHGKGSYMVNVKEKPIDYAIDILASEGHKGLVSDTLFSSSKPSNSL